MGDYRQGSPSFAYVDKNTKNITVHFVATEEIKLLHKCYTNPDHIPAGVFAT